MLADGTTCVSEDCLSWSTRYPRLLSQLRSFRADVLCLQEVQADHFAPYFQADLAPLGYEGVYKQRTGDKRDGCAIFYLKNKVERG